MANIVTETVGQVRQDQAATDQLTISLDKLPWSQKYLEKNLHIQENSGGKQRKTGGDTFFYCIEMMLKKVCTLFWHSVVMMLS